MKSIERHDELDEQVFALYKEWMDDSDESILRRIWELLLPYTERSVRKMRKLGWNIDHFLRDDLMSYSLHYLMMDIRNKRYPIVGKDAKAFGNLLVHDCRLTMLRKMTIETRMNHRFDDSVEPDWMISRHSEGAILNAIYLDEIPKYLLQFVKVNCRFDRHSPEYRMCLNVAERLVNSEAIATEAVAVTFNLSPERGVFFVQYVRMLLKLAIYCLKEEEGYDVVGVDRYVGILQKVNDERARHT